MTWSTVWTVADPLADLLAILVSSGVFLRATWLLLSGDHARAASMLAFVACVLILLQGPA